ncbi:hypothetical protein [Parasphingopyxis lamellibrachiae]|uniref:Uncharacterized protein n=1 Tax=Parasphingopyxis lamellibrachiae TaxID=680125 RepID=A0A3D9FHW2_9SPHN|nr:hypothetical protein [Parasphingopyxis lamellibrachiae]RED17238.1 hypothetical protein DFR46_2277 [Parasphingopyxis lamellibrachiae]
MPENLLIYIFIAIVAVIVFVVLLRTRGGAQEGAVGDDGVSDGLAAAVEDVVGEFTGVEVNPDFPGDTEMVGESKDGSGSGASISGGGAGDTLTQIKGLGPKASAGLAEMGVKRFEQIAGWTAGDIETVGARLGGTFAQRIERDRWVEQAVLLAEGNVEAFEAKFGKLG